MRTSMHRKCSFFALSGGAGVCERNRGRHSVPWVFLGINRDVCLTCILRAWAREYLAICRASQDQCSLMESVFIKDALSVEVGLSISFVFIGSGAYQIACIWLEDTVGCDKAESEFSKFGSWPLLQRENLPGKHLAVKVRQWTGQMKTMKMWYMMVEILITSVSLYRLIIQQKLDKHGYYRIYRHSPT